MKRLIENNFLYYTKNLTKIFLSIAFILSFISVVFVYDNLELNQIKREAGALRLQSTGSDSGLLIRALAEQNDFDIEGTELSEKLYFYLYSDTEFYNGETFQLTEEDLKVLVPIKEINEIHNQIGILQNGLSSLHEGGRMNIELTSFRSEISKKYAELADILGWEVVAEYANDGAHTAAYLEADHNRLMKLVESNTPDYFNKYTVTATNYPSKVFEGLSLFTILVFVLLLFYDLFSKDFDYDTYRTIFTEPYTRKTIIQSKLVFAFLYTGFLILIGMGITLLYLMIVKRVGYNILPSRVGYLLHPVLININPFTMIGLKELYIVVPVLVLNVLTIIVGGLLISLWIMFVSGLSFKLKSSSSTLTISTFILLAVFFISLTPFDTYFTLFMPLFGFTYEAYMQHQSFMNVIYLIVLTLVYIFVINKVFMKDITGIDLLGGDAND